jgi:hypothetical protein
MLMATLLARMPDLRRQVQADHVPDEHGYCRDCGLTRWPCELYEIATRAEHLDNRRLSLSA